MLGPIVSGSRMIAVTPPGCWGPMITPDFPAGHEVTRPVAVSGAMPGDAVALTIERIRVLSEAGTSGVHRNQPNSMYGNDPYVGKKCPGCGTVNPPSRVEGDGPGCIRCAKCGTPVQSCEMAAGYAMVLNAARTLGVTVNDSLARAIRADAAGYAALPASSRQHPANLLANGDLPGAVARIRPMVGNIGTLPDCRIPACHNAGDIAGRLVGDPHPLSLSEHDVDRLSDGHMDDNLVTEGVTLLFPVLVPGAGIYLGDIHAMQSDGEIAGHTIDVTAEVTVRVELIKGLELPGPLILADPAELPELVRPLSAPEWGEAVALAGEKGIQLEGPWVPLVAVGSGPTVNVGVASAIARLAKIMEMDPLEVRNRITFAGCIEIGRLPGTVHAGFLAPLARIPHPALRERLAERYLGSPR